MTYDDGLPPGWGGLGSQGQPKEPVVQPRPRGVIPVAAGFAVFMGGILGGLAGSLAGLALGVYDTADLLSLESTGDAFIRFLIMSSAGQFLAMGLLLAMFSRVSGTGNWARDYGMQVKGRDVFWIPLGTMVQLGSVILLALAAQALGIEVPTQEAAEAVEGSRSTLQQIGLGIMIIAVAPVIEEVLFRGLWLRAMVAKYGRTTAVIATSLLFGLAHLLDPSTAFLMPALVIVGIVLAAVTLRTGRLGPAIMIHVGFNLTTFVILLAPAGL